LSTRLKSNSGAPALTLAPRARHSPSSRSMLGGSVSASRGFRPRPATRLRSTPNDQGTALPSKAAPFCAAPGAQVRFQLRRVPCDFDGGARFDEPKPALHRQMAALFESQPAEIYLHCEMTFSTNVSTERKRSTAVESCRYQLVRPGSHFLSPSMSSNGRTSAFSYSSSRNCPTNSAGPPRPPVKGNRRGAQRN
jgi:hypothetical protein